jgi:outer membrane protein
VIASNDRSLGNAGFLPSLNLGAQQNRRTMGSGFGEMGAFEGGTLDVVTTLNYTVFDGFRRGVLYRQLGAFEDQAAFFAEQVLEETLASVAIVYYDLARQQQQIETLREAIEISEDRLRIAEFQWDVGSASELEVRRAQVDRNADVAALLRQEVQLQTGRATLNRLMGQEWSEEYRVTDTIPVDKELDPDRLTTAALRNNRALLVAEQGAVAAELEGRAIRRERLPVVGFQLGYAFNNLADPLGLAASRPSGFTYGMTMGLNLFDGLNRERRIQNARIRHENSVLAIRDARNRVITGLEAAHASYRNRIVLVELEEENAELARQNVEVALERFRLGLSTSLELREVQNALTNARGRLALARFEAKQAEIDLLRLSGQFPR